MEDYTRLIIPALLAIIALGGFGYYETIMGLADGMALDIPGVQVGRIVLGTVGCLALAAMVSRVTQRVVTWRMARRGRQSPRLLHEMIAALLFVAALVAIFAFVFDRSLTGVLATSGVLIAVLGFALRNTIADVVSGIALSLESPFRIGDWIETEAGVAGKVIEVTWRATRVETRDQVQVVLPNSRIAGGRVTNYSAPRRHYRVQQSVTLDPGVPVSRAKQVLLEGLLAAPRIRKAPPPDVRVRGFGAQGFEYVVRYWVPSHADEVDCRDAVLASLDRHLRFAGVETAHPRSACATGQQNGGARPGLLNRVDRGAAIGRSGP